MKGHCRGWAKAVFEEALGQAVEVELAQAIGSRDECCEFHLALTRVYE